MGNSSSTTIQQTIQVVMDIHTTIIQSQYNQSSSSFNSTNTMNVTYINSHCDNNNFSQSINGTYNVTGYFASSNQSQIINDLTTALQQASTSSNAQVSAFLQSTLNYNNTNVSVKDYLSTNMTTLVQNTTFNTCTNSAILTNSQTVVLDNSSGKYCNLSQNIQFAFAASCTITSVLDASSNNTILNTAAQNAKDSTSQTGNGVSQAISAIGDVLTALETPFTYALIAGIVVIGGITIWFLFGGSVSTTNQPQPQQQQPQYYYQPMEGYNNNEETH